MVCFFSGSIFALFLVISLFFLRYGQRTGERLFYLFSVSFFLMALERFLTVSLQLDDEKQWFLYLIRLVAFLLIIKAVVDQNRRAKIAR